MHERGGRRHTEAEPTSYLKAARFDDGELSQHVYFGIHRAIRRAQRAGEVTDLAAHHLTDQEAVHWYVAVVGQHPPHALDETLSTALAQGEQAPLPEQFVALVTRYRPDRRSDTMTLDEWLAGSNQDGKLGEES